MVRRMSMTKVTQQHERQHHTVGRQSNRSTQSSSSSHSSCTNSSRMAMHSRSMVAIPLSRSVVMTMMTMTMPLLLLCFFPHPSDAFIISPPSLSSLSSSSSSSLAQLVGLQRSADHYRHYRHHHHHHHHHGHHHNTLTTHLHSSTRKSSSSASSSAASDGGNRNGGNVLFSKVVRPAPYQDPLVFLPQLVEYLQDKFRLPINLPMIYERLPESSNNKNNNNYHENNEDGMIAAWYSPLSDTKEESCLYLKVVPIQTEDGSIPEMAMVAVSKRQTSTTTAAAGSSIGVSKQTNMNALFQASEKKILKALDRGLDQFSAGTILGLTSSGSRSMSHPATTTTTGTWQSVSRQELEDSDKENDHVMNEDDDDDDKTSITTVSQAVFRNPKNSTTIEAKSVPKEEQAMSSSSTDFAVQQAAVAAATVGKAKTTANENKQKSKQKTAKEGDEDFAVRAAKEIMAKKKSKSSTSTKTASSDGKTSTESLTETSSSSSSIPPRSPPPEPSDVQRRLHGPSWSISTPQQRKKSSSTTEPLSASLESVSEKKKTKQNKNDEVEEQTVQVSSVIQDGTSLPTWKQNSQPSDSYLDAEIISSENEVQQEGQSSSSLLSSPKQQVQSMNDMSHRKLNLNIVDSNDIKQTDVYSPFSYDKDEDLSLLQDKDTDSEDVKRAKEAQRIMAEIAQEQGKDMTAEELLKDVLKFDQEQKQEDAVGSGFVSGAFEKAKELLRERKQQRDTKVQQQVKFKEINTESIKILDPNDFDQVPKEMSPEEELKQLFRAGEELAQRRNLDLTDQDRSLTEEQERQVDELLSQEKTISNYARTLDDELAQLEVRINRNPEEEMDGPMQNAMFDVMSGPEVYNRNVDPETAVNWPGALPGTKRVRLPKELDEAVKQAQFAANVIMKMKEELVVMDDGEETIQYTVGNRTLSHDEVLNLKTVVHEAVTLGLIADPVVFVAEQSRLQILLDELWNQPEERFREIAENYKDLLLSENFVGLLKLRLTEMADRDVDIFRKGDPDGEMQQRHERERSLLSQMVVYAQLLLKEARALGAELEAQQIEVIRSICKVAMDPSLTTEEETARALTDAVRDMRPLLDETFVAYLKYAVAEEEGRLARAGLIDDPQHNQWLMVLTIVQQGVYAEIAKGINRYIEHIFYVLRMETRQQRKSLLAELIDVMPTLDVRPFVKVVENIAASLGDAAKGEIDPMGLGEMTNKILQLHRDVHDLLPPERINEMAKDADEWAAKQKRRLLEQRNMTVKRLQESRETEHLADAILKGRAEEVERFE